MKSRDGIDAAEGQHIRLIEMPNDPSPIPAGATGRITHVVTGPLEQLWMSWEPPHERRTLNLVPGDVYEVIEAP